MAQDEEPEPADVAEWGFGVCVCGATFTLKSDYIAHKAVCPTWQAAMALGHRTEPVSLIVKPDQ